MEIKVIFFGFIAERLGKRERLLPINQVTSLADVVKEVGCDQFKPLLLAVNMQQVNDLNTVIKVGDEVAIMPPFSGG